MLQYERSVRIHPKTLALVASLVALIVLGKWSMDAGLFSPALLRDWLVGLGAWGYLGYLAAFSLGELLQWPGFVFVSTAILVYGKWVGGLLAYVGSALAATVMFLFVRLFKKKSRRAVVHPKLETVLKRLEQKPIQTVAWVRLLLWFLPGTNVALALSSLSVRHFILGSLLGYIPFMLIVILLADSIFQILGIA